MDTQRVATQETVRRFLAERFLFDPEAPIDPARSLIETGVLDSTGVMELVMFLEATFAIKVADADLVPKNLDGLAAIAAFVERKQAAAPLHPRPDHSKPEHSNPENSKKAG